jgi:hypothetical protein
VKANDVHVSRFRAMCSLLEARRHAAPTTHFTDQVPLALNAADKPLAASRWRRGRRQVEQAWSNLVSERRA